MHNSILDVMICSGPGCSSIGDGFCQISWSYSGTAGDYCNGDDSTNKILFTFILKWVCNLQYTLGNISQGSRTVDSYFIELKGIWEELRSYRPLPHCKCGNCNSDCFKAYSDQYQKDMVFRFLNGLNDSFSAIRSQIIMMDPIPTLDKVYSLVQREETQRSLLIQGQAVFESSAMMTVVETRKKCTRKDISRDHCGKKGHTKDKCYKVIGFLEDFKFTKSKPNFMKAKAVANNATSIHEGPESDGCKIEQLEEGTGTGSMSQLLAIKQQISITLGHLCFHTSNNLPPNLKNVNAQMIKQNHWIVDSGATDHICYSLDSFESTKTVNNCYVELPNDRKATVSHIGIVKLSPTLTLKNVLHVPSFKFNLLFVGKLTQNKKTYVLFTDMHCIVQDVISQTVIGVARAYTGLYLMQEKHVEKDTSMSGFDKLKFPFISSVNGCDSADRFHQLSCVETLQQNGVVERKHQHILVVARALLFQSSLPTHFWGDAVMTAVHIINRVPTRLLKNKSLFELLYKRQPSYEHLRVFGSLCFVSTLSQHRKKLDQRATKCIFLGYPNNTKGYRVYDLNANRIIISRNIVFHEGTFPFQSKQHTTWPEPFCQTLGMHTKYSPQIDSKLPNFHCQDYIPADTYSSEPNTSAQTPSTSQINDFEPNSLDTVSMPTATNNENVTSSNEHDPNENLPVRKSTRHKHAPKYMDAYHLDMPSKSHNVTAHPITKFLSTKNLSPAYKTFTTSLSYTFEPSTYHQAASYSHWRDAMSAELKALQDNETWSIIPRPLNSHVIGCKWVYKVKLNADGQIERYKARLVAKGYNQIAGFDYKETFSPVAKQTTVRVFFAIATAFNWHLTQLDVNNAFLNGDLKEEVYMDIPPGYEIQGEYPENVKLVCKLHKSLYGLKQASREWNAKITSLIIQYGFIQSNADRSLFTMKTNNGEFFALLLYVDDILVGSYSKQAADAMKLFLSSHFKLKDLGTVKYFLGLEIARSPKGISISQRKYTLDLLEEHGLLGAKPVSTPIDYNQKLVKAQDEEKLINSIDYRQLVKKLLYLTFSRPDIAYAVQVLSQFMDKPSLEHMNAAHRVLKYLKGSLGQGILMKSESNLMIVGYCDSDWAGCPNSRKSITRYNMFIGNSLVTWKFKKQSVVSRSSEEAKYRAMASASCEIIWLKHLLADFGIEHKVAVVLYSDSQSTIHISKNPVFHERTKHIEMDCHFIREKVIEGTIKPIYISTDLQLADLFTKALQPRQFHNLLNKMNVHNIHISS
ncbi:Cysteine-rich RLK (RECEPTOR-like protein kinase) 8 [Theobroma cacao]|uniref:Cysteine-rich RLK (RECEPTOR-like protein kinase) 8 n=1 Tax=Theobroma cacao TaxID=3641 RepID=A0A061GIC0_THECC|nr:Cysteine-rich RLK (RECEPTOR-like protein kinase) 8 [Theobroma cacao]